MTDLSVKVSLLDKTQAAKLFDGRKMSDGEKAARLYLGKKQIERELRIDRVFMTIWACLAIAALATPFILFWGV
jgi:hypothetical protein